MDDDICSCSKQVKYDYVGTLAIYSTVSPAECLTCIVKYLHVAELRFVHAWQEQDAGLKLNTQFYSLYCQNTEYSYTNCSVVKKRKKKRASFVTKILMGKLDWYRWKSRTLCAGRYTRGSKECTTNAQFHISILKNVRGLQVLRREGVTDPLPHPPQHGIQPCASPQAALWLSQLP